MAAPGNSAAKASIDIALHDLLGKIVKQPWFKLWGFSPENAPDTSFTIGIDSPEVVQHKVKEAPEFKILKVKLGGQNDREIIESIRLVSDVPLFVDINQGWTNKKQALDFIFWLKEKGVVLVEQPLPKGNLDDSAWLTQHSPLPVIADESVQRLSDLNQIKGAFSGINVKLMKCTGMREAHKMINFARANRMSVLIGCMTETSCAISAAAQLSPVADWADLDGNLLITNDPFTGIQIINGKIVLNGLPGIGINIS
jgi:L-alanine-DL-glutamate epimerase-like enolase superfamily enzyme